MTTNRDELFSGNDVLDLKVEIIANSQLQVILENENDTVKLGNLLSKVITTDTTIFLLGDLGAGKTTFTRGFIQALGYNGIVKSPTYTLVESYKLPHVMIYHFDLYRLMDPEELEFMGIRDYFMADSIRLIEWPNKGEGFIPNSDINLTLIYNEHGGRTAEISANTAKGKELLDKLVIELK